MNESKRHHHGSPCPVTGKPIPLSYIWTDKRNSRQHFNACAACTSIDGLKTLRELNDEREAAARGAS